MALKTRYTLDGVSQRDIDRFWSHVRKTDTCWLWTSGLGAGYGKFSVPSIDCWTISTHVFSFLLAGGLLSEDKPCVLHTCDVKLCVRPEHLYAGDAKQNAQDREHRDRANRAHGYASGNTILRNADIREIRDRASSGDITQRQLAKEFGVREGTISRIVHNKRWAWLPSETSNVGGD